MSADAALACVCVAALAALAAPARAGGEKAASVDNVAIVVRTPWPDMQSRGAQPFLFEVQNQNAEPRRVELELTNGFGARTDRLHKTLDLEAGARASFEMFAPVQAQYSSAYYLQAQVGGESQYVPGIGASAQPEWGVRNVLVISRDGADSSAQGNWQARMNVGARRPSVPSSPPAVAIRRGASATATLDAVVVTSVRHRDLPTRYEAYTSVDGLVLDSASGLPGPEALAAILAWTRLGGRLAVLGPDAHALARSTAELAPWMEERFRSAREGGVETFACGAGALVVGTGRAVLDDPAQARALNAAMEASTDWIPKLQTRRDDGLSIELPGLDLPYRALTLILLLFALVIGPINFYVVRRIGKPILILITVPALALAFSLALFAYGALAQGLDVRAFRATFALLDQRAHRSSAVELRAFFAGLSAGAGLVPGPGASVWSEPGGSDWREQRSYAIDFTAGTLYGGDFLPVRTPVRQTFLVDRPCRLRVEFRREGTGWRVENGLGVVIRSIGWCDADGELHEFEGTIEPGAGATLVPAGDLSSRIAQARILGVSPADEHSGLPRGSYVAVLDASPFADSCGVEAREVGGLHAVLGVVDLLEAR